MSIALKSKFYHTFMYTHFKVFYYKLQSEITIFALYGWYNFYLPQAFQASVITTLIVGWPFCKESGSLPFKWPVHQSLTGKQITSVTDTYISGSIYFA